MQIPSGLRKSFSHIRKQFPSGYLPKGTFGILFHIAGLTFVLALSGKDASAQLNIIDHSYDFGMLLRADDNWADFEIHNSGTKEAVIFRVEGPKNTDVKLSAKTVKPGTSEFIRVAVSPTAIGKFKIDLKVFASAWQKPETIQIKGESSFTTSSMIPCPDFSGNKQESGNEFNISVRDEILNTPLEDAKIDVYKDGRRIETIHANEYGEASAKLTYGRYFFSIQSNGGGLDTALYVNAINSHLLARLDIKEVPRDEPLIAEGMGKRETKEILKKEPVMDSVIVPNKVPDSNDNLITEAEDENVVLPLSNFKENNLVFLVDVSASMNRFGKLDLLKIAMVQLLDVLRPVDRFSLISYSGETNLIIETENQLDRQACIDAILALEARGSTAGAKAIDKAGEVALAHFVQTGNNQIILATDGAFDEGVDKALRLAARYAGKDIRLSVLGIKCGPATTKQMKELTEAGEGRYIPVNIAADAGEQLIDEIKKSSVR